MIWEEPSSASKIVKIAPQQTLGLLLSVFWTVIVWPLLRFLTISGVINSDSSEICVVGKIRHEATSSMIWEEPISASKIVKIAHQQTLGLLLSVFLTVTVWPLLRFLTISGVIELRFKRNLCRWKDKTW